MSALTWGNPSAARRVLLIHGLTGSSNAWHRIAPGFASRGYYVVAPDLLGHGNARRSPDYTIAALADEFRPYFTVTDGNEHPYDIVIGHSLGGVVASALLPLLKSTRPVQVVLSDPPLEQTAEAIAYHRALFTRKVRDPKPPEVLQQENPSLTKEDAVFAWLGAELCDLAAVETIFEQNTPWSFSHLLLTAPDNVKLDLFAADPTKDAKVNEKDLKAYPRVTSKTVWGASHDIPAEAPQVLIEAALQVAAASQN